jgi:hypothetical protein
MMEEEARPFSTATVSNRPIFRRNGGSAPTAALVELRPDVIGQASAITAILPHQILLQEYSQQRS